MLGFDRDRVRLLLATLRETVAHLGGLTSDDPDAVDALALVTRTHDRLQSWLGTLRDLSADRVMERVVPVDLAGLDRMSFDAHVLAVGAGWTTVEDPLIGSVGPLLDDEQVVSLVRQLDGHALTALLTELGRTRALHLQGTATGWGSVAAIDRVIGLIAQSIGAVTAATDALLDDLPPDTAGLVVSALDTDAETLARLAVEVLERWHHRPLGAADTTAWPLDSPADHLFAALADDHHAATAFVTELLDHPDGFHLLTDTALDPFLATSVMLTATDPTTCTTAAAGSIIRPYIVHVLDEMGTPGVPYDTRYRDLLGPIVAPWLAQMTSRAADWGWTPPIAAAELTRVLQDDEATAALLAARDRWLVGLQALVGIDDPRTTAESLHDLSGMLGWLDAIAEVEEVDDELADRVLWDLGWDIADQLAVLAVKATGLHGLPRRAANAAALASLDAVKADAEESGWWIAPRPVGVVISDARQRHDWRRATLAASTASAVYGALMAQGGLTQSTPPPPPPPDAVEADGCTSLEWQDDLQEWLRTEVDEPARSAIDLAVATMLNDYQAADACHELLD